MSSKAIDKHSHLVGVLITLTGSFFWACSGVAGQIMFVHYGVSAITVIPLCLFASGLLLLVVQWAKKGIKAFEPLRDKRTLGALVLFGLLGNAGNQFAYFQTDYYSNAAWATAMCYTSPVLVNLFYFVRHRQRPTLIRVLSLLLMVIGVVVISTHGDLGTLAVSLQAFVWGVIASFTFSFCSIQPQKLMERYGSPLTNGWGFLFGGFVIALFSRSWEISGTWVPETFALAAFVTLVGTVGGFCLYLKGVSLVGAKNGSMLVTLEVPTSAFLTFLAMGTPLVTLDYVGFLLIVASALFAALNADTVDGTKAQHNKDVDAKEQDAFTAS